MAVPVQGDDVAGRRDLGEQRGPPLDLLSDDEEGRACARARERIEDRRRSLGMGSVVERQRDAVRPPESAGQTEPGGEPGDDGSEQMADHDRRR